jgi:superfamily II DNA or RNA helicase
MEQPLIPYQYQLADIDKIVANGGSGIVATQVGGGKTLIAIEVAKRMKFSSVLVIAPKGTHKRAWERTIKRQEPSATVRYINSTVEGKRAYADLLLGRPGWFLISPEFFRRFSWSTFKKVDMAIFDEAHRASNRKAKTAVALHSLKSEARLAMSGTIAGNRIDGMWSILKWVFPDLAGRSYWAWVGKFLKTRDDFFAGKVPDGEKNPGEIVASIPCYIRHLKREQCCVEHPNGIDGQLPPMTVEERVVQLSPEQKKIYKQLEKDLLVWLGENPLVVEVPVAMRVRLRQITLGVPTIAEDGSVDFDINCRSSKFDELGEIITDSPVGEQMLVLTHSQKFARVVVSRLSNLGYNAVEWSGAVPQKKRDEYLEAFIGGEIQFIVAVISAIGEGTDGLQEACSTVVWLSKDDNRLLNEQAAGRLDRRGQTRSVVSYEIIAEDTYDEGQLSKLVREQLAMNESLREKENGR